MSDDRPPPSPTGGDGLFSPLLEAAIRLAARGHYHQFRKTADSPAEARHDAPQAPERVPYITHLMGTVCILARLGVRDEVLAAAALHDYLEDVADPDGAESIRRVGGDEVLAIVLAVTEDKRRDRSEADTWELRKREQVARVKVMPEDAVLVKAADVLHNVQSLLADIQRTDDLASVWRPFNAGPRRQLWYFESVSEAVNQRLGDHPLSRGLRTAVSCLRTALPG